MTEDSRQLPRLSDADEIMADLVWDRIKQAKRNSELGWCPCGEERDCNCECFATYRLSATQGFIPIGERRIPAGYIQCPACGGSGMFNETVRCVDCDGLCIVEARDES
jgi:hypothetical protein